MTAAGGRGRVTNRIRRLREAAGLTQAELAERVGATRQTIIAVEAEKYAPSLELAFRIAHTFNVQLSDVFIYNPENDPVLNKLKAKQDKNKKQ